MGRVTVSDIEALAMYLFKKACNEQCQQIVCATIVAKGGIILAKKAYTVDTRCIFTVIFEAALQPIRRVVFPYGRILRLEESTRIARLYKQCPYLQPFIDDWRSLYKERFRMLVS